MSQEGDRGEALRLTGAPKETITLTVEIDAADQLEQGDPVTVANGLHPALAALETMLYPTSASVIVNDALSLVGTIEVIPLDGPMTLFVWGPTRVLPVRLTSEAELRIFGRSQLSITYSEYHLTASQIARK